MMSDSNKKTDDVSFVFWTNLGDSFYFESDFLKLFVEKVILTFKYSLVSSVYSEVQKLIRRFKCTGHK